MPLSSSAVSLPKPGKRKGEDAHFFGPHTLGVADGVGGWARHGVDAGLYAESLMKHARRRSLADRHPQRILWYAYNQSQKVAGSATACVMTVNDQRLHSSVVGDCGYVVLRQGAPIYQSAPQMHRFNLPHQLGRNMDTPDSAAVHSMLLEPDDIIVLGTDGVFDNLHMDEMVRIVQRAPRQPDVLAQHISQAAFFHSLHPTRDSPFAQQARQAGLSFTGGKQDDITVVVSLFGDSTAWAQTAPAAPPPPTR
jgi:protein phosphatase PTC7